MTFVVNASHHRAKRWLLLVAATLALMLGAAAIALAALVTDSGTHDLTVPNKNVSTGLVDIGNASVEYIGSSAQNQASGTGLFDPFVRLQGSPTEKGYNTDGAVAFDTKSGTWTHAIKVNAIPVVDCDGDGAGTATCWELFVDINDSNTAKRISLNEVEIWFTTNANLVGFVDPTGFPSGATKEYDFSGAILINDVNQGSGRGDLRYLVPTADHTWNADTYFVLYSKWGTTAPTVDAENGTGGWTSDGGFEEWKVRKTPNVSILKTANPVGPVNAGDNIGFDITITNSGVETATDVVITDNLPPGSGSDLNWSLSPSFAGCSISGAIGSQVLTCTFASLAAGASIGPIHITSDTTAADCAQVTNTGTVTTGNDGGGSSTASVSVQCGALVIHKQSTKSGNPLVSAAGAVFAVDGPDAGTTADFSVTDDTTAAAPDEDADIGEVCVTGLAPGTYTVNETTPPPGYGGASQTDVSVTVTNGSTCATAAATAAVFTNPPLGEIEVQFRDLGSGETAASIVCKQGTTTLDAVSEDGDPDPAFDDEDETFTNLPPGTYDCQVVIDP